MKYSEVRQELRDWIDKTASVPENLVFRILSKFGIKTVAFVITIFCLTYNPFIPPEQNLLALDLLAIAAIYPAFNFACLCFFRQKEEINWFLFYGFFCLSWVFDMMVIAFVGHASALVFAHVFVGMYR